MKMFSLSARMRRFRDLGLATTGVRDQLMLLTVVFACFCPWPASALPVLNILTQTQRLDSALVQEFETTRKVSVRVEFVSSGTDYESRIRALPQSWDLVIADEQKLINLSLSKILRSLPESLSIPPDGEGLERRSRANQDGRTYLNLMADPLGVIFLKNTLQDSAAVRWNWLVEPSLNPLWRSRLALFSDDRMNLLTAAVATGFKLPADENSETGALAAWLEKAQLQGRMTTLSAAIPKFLTGKFAVGLAWQSDYLHAFQYVRNLGFTVPAEGTYVERIGIGLVSDSRNEQLAVDFIKFMSERRNQLAKSRGLLPLTGHPFAAIPASGWRIFSDDVPRLRELKAALSRSKKDKTVRLSKNPKNGDGGSSGGN
ncbi:MAG: extracellular solute-binding protein [Proteobacteria bacterium]|nr:extracellular solute-binding protein [Pseudomonadota bacterium]